MMITIAINFLKGLLFGGLASLIGYAKQEKPEKWEFTKMLKTMIIGSFTVATTSAAGMDLFMIAGKISDYLATEGIVLGPLLVYGIITTALIVFADEIVKIIVRRTDISTLFDKFKAWVATCWHK